MADDTGAGDGIPAGGGDDRPRRIHAFDPPERFVVGTVGAPGSRTFYLQARAGSRTVSVGLEKAQVEILAERLGELLDELGRRGVDTGPAEPPGDVDRAPLDSPVEEEFRVAAIALGWDPERDLVVLEAQAPSEKGSTGDALNDDADGPDVLRVHVTPAAARAFVARARRVVAAGRPPCPLCGLPLEDGHVCPRQNGHRPRA